MEFEVCITHFIRDNFSLFLYRANFLLQSILGELLEQVVYQVQLVDTRSQEIGIPVAIRKEIRENMHAILRSITRVMSPSAFFRSTMNLLGHNNRNVGKKVHELILLCFFVFFH